MAAAAAPAARRATAFPGPGHVVGTALQPVLPIPLKKGDVFPPPTPASTPVVSSPPSEASPPPAPVVSSTPSGSRTLSANTAPTQSHPTNLAVPPLKCRDEVLSEGSDDDDDNELYNCGRCLLDIDRNSASYYCPLCVKVFHTQCITGHQCSYVS